MEVSLGFSVNRIKTVNNVNPQFRLKKKVLFGGAGFSAKSLYNSRFRLKSDRYTHVTQFIF